MQNLLRIVLAGAILWAAPAWADTTNVVQGRIDWIELDHFLIGSQRYEVIYPATEKGKADAQTYGFETECWMVVPTKPYKFDYITLVKIGYVDLARVTLQNGMVRTIEVLDLQQ